MKQVPQVTYIFYCKDGVVSMQNNDCDTIFFNL